MACQTYNRSIGEINSIIHDCGDDFRMRIEARDTTQCGLVRFTPHNQRSFQCYFYMPGRRITHYPLLKAIHKALKASSIQAVPALNKKPFSRFSFDTGVWLLEVKHNKLVKVQVQ